MNQKARESEEVEKAAAQYPKTVRWSEEDAAFVGTVHGLVGDCCHGDNPVAVYRECEEIARECIEAAVKSGGALPKICPQAPAAGNPSAATIRALMGMSQVQFAKFLGISPKTLHKWEQGTSDPSGAARSLLRLAAAEPRVVRKVLGS